jgi:hypothetical protein
VYFPSTLGHLCLYSCYEAVLAFGIYTVLEIVLCKEIHLDELSEQSYEEIKETVFTTTTTTTTSNSLGSKVDFANQKIFECKLESSKAELKLYWIIISLVITHAYANKTWVLKESMKRNLLITEREILRRICGTTKDRDST